MTVGRIRAEAAGSAPPSPAEIGDGHRPPLQTFPMPLAVLNPGGNDPDQHFPDGAGAPDPQVHAPVNYHAFAACTRGTFHRKDQAVPADVKHVLMLLRRDLKACRQAMIELKHAKKIVAIAFKEAGSGQIAELLAKPRHVSLFQEICARCDGAIATTPDAVPLFQSVGVRAVEFLPTPYPVEDMRWDFSIPPEDRRGIFIGTREFDAPSRNHLAALLGIKLMAEAMMEPVTVFNVDGWRGRRMLDRLRYSEGMLKVIEGRRPYPSYLRTVAMHKLVLQLDMSAVPGQVAGDALLCRLPCLGGHGTTERLAFPDLCGHGRSAEQVLDLAARMLEHGHDCEEAAAESQRLARARLGFEVVAKRVGAFFEQIAR